VDGHIGGLEAQNGAMEAQDGALDSLLNRTMVADSHNFDEEQDLDPDPHCSV
jgi:hypothetical protein